MPPAAASIRTLVIGDIHGHLNALEALLARVHLREFDRVIFLGDYVDKGPDTRGVLDYLLAFKERHEMVPLRGNHDQMLLDAHRDGSKLAIWQSLAGDNPLSGYEGDGVPARMKSVPAAHWAFLEKECGNFFETPDFIFVHGRIRPSMQPSQEEVERLQWTTLASAEKHESGRTVICGHSPQASGLIGDLGHTICVDTGIANGGWLSCLNLETFEFWQAKATGETRVGKLRDSGAARALPSPRR